MQFHHQEGVAVVIADVEERADVRVRELRDGARFAVESIAQLGIHRQRARQHFDRHRSVQPCVARSIDFAHSAGADGREDLVRTEARAFGEGHARWILPRITTPALSHRG